MTPFGHRTKSLAALIIGAALPLLAGCNIDRDIVVGSIPDDYRTRHPITLQEGLATLDVPVAVAPGGIATDQRSNVVAFARNFVDSGAPVIAIVVPSGSPNQTAAAATAGQIRTILQANGIPATAIDMRAYAAGPKEANAAVRLAYSRVIAKAGPCGQWPDQSADTSENRNYQNFGCATQQNLAAQIADPLDLVYPRASAPPDAERRSVVLDNYRQSKPIQSDNSRESGTNIASSPR